MAVDVLIIGCGMAGLAAGIRLGMYGKSVRIVERHNAPGGLNGFYSFDGIKYDVGLHAVTNYVAPGVRGTPLGKLLRQLRIPREALDLCPQRGSRIAFPGVDLRFDNDIALLTAEIARQFPAEVDGFQRLRQWLAAENPFATGGRTGPTARAILSQYIGDPLLREMLLCPLLYYGSAREQDMDGYQFVILWRSLYEEGFARPYDGVRTIIRALLKRLREVGVPRTMQCGVRRILVRDGRAVGAELDDGSVIEAATIISTAGAVETYALCAADDASPPAPDPIAHRATPRPGTLGFVETIRLLRRAPTAWGWHDTIVFFNDAPRFDYQSPAQPIDTRSGVICLPDNYEYGADRSLPLGVMRVTALANWDFWSTADDVQYAATKADGFAALHASACRFLPAAPVVDWAAETVTSDMFTPRTVARFTGHCRGAVYGSPDKALDGRTPWRNLYLAGSDQGFLGIVGAMLSGISMANAHVLARPDGDP
jgi:phytoene dehydrogenase-like protein